MLKPISVQRLTIGMYVSLREIPWFNHPFLVSNFEITKESDIRDIVALGKKNILYDPGKSTSEPLTKDAEIKVKKNSKMFTSKTSLKNKKASELRKRRLRFQKMEKEFTEALTTADSVLEGVMNGQVALCDDAKKISREMAHKFIDEVNLAVQHINASANEGGHHFHGLNVMILSLMLGKELGLEADDMETLGLGALVHDIGLLRIPKSLVHKTRLTKKELEIFREHPKLGVAILSKMPDIDPNVMKIVYQHHEECDGKGYPKGLKGDAFPLLSRIVAIADVYERMINPKDPKFALSPHKALAYLYGRKKEAKECNCLETFIKLLGVYPPGTVCRFTSGDIGIILGVNPKTPLQPEVIIYDPSIPKHDAIIYRLGVDLDLNIETTLTPKEIDIEALNYLDSRSKIQYFPISDS